MGVELAPDRLGQVLGHPEHVRDDAAAYVRKHARDDEDAAELLGALGLTDTTPKEDSSDAQS